MTHRMTDYRDDPADLGDPGQQHPLDAMAWPIQTVRDVADFLDPDNAPIHAESCTLYRNLLRRADKILSSARTDLEPHRGAIAAWLEGQDPLKRLAEALDARIAKMTACLAEQQPDSARAAEVRAKLAECEVMRRWVVALRSGY